jgi:hypothetical protein
MKKLLYLLLFAAIVIHFMFLQFLGVSSFITTVLFYYVIYLFLKALIYLRGKTPLAKVILTNAGICLVLLLLAEFCCTFIFNLKNGFMENKRGVYLSPYMHQRQLLFFHRLGFGGSRNTWEYGYLPNYTHFHSTIDFNYKVTYNKAGLRGPLPQTDTSFRICVLGDSFVEGYGAPADSTFPVLLEKYLRGYKKNTDVINGGTCGSNPASAINLYNNLLKNFHPDILLLELNDLDVKDYYAALHEGKMTLTEDLYAISHIFRLIYESGNFSELSSPAIKKMYIDKMISILEKFEAEITRSGKQLILMQALMQPQVYSETSLLRARLLKSQIPFIDLQKDYQRNMRNRPADLAQFFWEHDGHHTSRGYNLAAKIIAEKLIERKYVRIN